MVKIIWTDRALQDLKDIGDYIAKDSPQFAKVTLEKILDQTHIIENHPKIGRIVPELKNKRIREIIWGNYRIIYLLKTEYQADILTVHHSSMLLSKDLKKGKG